MSAATADFSLATELEGKPLYGLRGVWEAECKAYCEKHSSECPGFPRVSPTPKPTLTTSNKTETLPTKSVVAEPTHAETTSGFGTLN